MADIIFCDSGPFFALFFLPTYGPRKSKFFKKWKKHLKIYHFTNINDSHLMYVSSDPPDNPENQYFEKMKKRPGDIIILHVCNINHNYMMHGSWAIEFDGQNFLTFWTVFCHFTPLTTWKNKILKTEKKAWRYYHFTQVYQKPWSYTILFLRYDM